MIYWLNGAYGAGKSTVAEKLKERIGNAHIFDAEEVGNAVRDNYPESLKHSIIFDGYPLWREMNVKLLKDMAQRYDGDIIVPMTLILDEAREEIIGGLTDGGIAVLYIFLDADAETLRARILARGEEEGCWCMENIPMALGAQASDAHAVHINTVGRTVDEIAEDILTLKAKG